MKKTISYAAAVLTTSLAAMPAIAQRPLGVDVSAYQGSINWASVHSDGVVFAFAKATEGTYLEDSEYHTNMSNGKNAGVLMGPYDFARPDEDTPAQEASYFWSYAKSNIKADKKTLMPVVAFDIFDGHVGTSTYTQWFNDWSADVIADGQAAGVTLSPLIMGDCTALCDLNLNNNTLGLFVVDLNGENLYTGDPSCSCFSVNTQWIFWQVSDTGAITGISGDVDLDTFNGNTTQLKASEVVTAFP